MKILLLSDIPPCDNYTAGLVLSAMVRLVPRDQICCFTVANPALDVRLSAEFANIPIEMHAKPNENWAWLPQQRFIRRLSSVAAFVGETINAKTAVRELINKAVAFGREQKVDRVWAVLQGQTTIRMAEAVAERLGVPLHTHVWDPFSWWAKANKIDGITTRRLQAMFDSAIRNSRCVATASEPMAELFRERFSVSAVPVIASHPKSMAQTPKLGTSPKAAASEGSANQAPIVIGMAGQFYAASEWLQLLHAMRASNWTIAGRPVRIVVMGPQRPPGTLDEHVSFLGWKSQQDAAFILSLCDILYCPYPFDAGMKEVSLYSFPSKLVLYLAAGRPILFHGPDYSSPAHYIRSRQCGLLAKNLVATAVYNELERLIRDPVSYRVMAENAQKAFQEDFTLQSMERSLNTFIGNDAIAGNAEVCLYDHTEHGGDTSSLSTRLSAAERRRSVVWLARTLARTGLTRYAHTRRQFRLAARRLLLRVPRLRSLYHEIHTLYAEKAVMTQQIAALENEIARLNALPRNVPTVAPKKETTNSTDDEVSLRSFTTISPQFVSNLHPETKALVLAQSLNEMASVAESEPAGSKQTALETKTHFMIGSVGYAILPPAGLSVVRWTGDWDATTELLPGDSVALLLRLVLEQGFDRLVIAGDNPGDVALASYVACLASRRLTVVAIADDRPPGWLLTQEQLDFVPGPAKLQQNA